MSEVVAKHSVRQPSGQAGMGQTGAPCRASQPAMTAWPRFVSWAQQPVVTSFVAGGVAGAVSRTVVSPFERMKIIFQVQGPGSAAYQGVFPTLGKMWSEEGWRGFMRGNGVNCVRIVPYSAVQFSAYTILKARWIQYKAGDGHGHGHGDGDDDLSSSSSSSVQLTSLERLTAGAIAGIASVAATYPLDIVRTRLSIQTATLGAAHSHNQPLAGAQALAKPPGMWSVMGTMYRNEGGVKALYRGIVPTTMGVAPYVGLNFAVYETMREVVTPRGQKDPGAIGMLAAGAVSGAVAQTLTYPFDVLRRRFQVLSMGAGQLGFQYDSVWGALRSIAAKEGVRGMYKGLSANLLKVVPSMASSWLSFEYTREVMLRL